MSAICIYFQQPVAFGYHEYFFPFNIFEQTYKFVPLLLSVGFGFILGKRIRLKNFKIPKFKFKLKKYMGIVYLVTFGIYIVGTLITDPSTSLNGEIHRVLESKFSHLLLIFSGVSLISNIHLRKFVAISYMLTFFIVLSFALIDGTRSAIIPLIILILWFAGHKQYTKLFFASITTAFTIGLVFYGRFLARGNDFQDLLFMIEFIVNNFSISYFSAYSWLHFLFAIEQFKGNFSLSDMWYSITPVPSSLLPYSPDTSLWRLDAYRPLGAQASLYLLGLIPWIFFNLVIGFVLGLATKIDNAVIRILVFGVIFLTFASSFQYNLRSVQWFLWFAIGAVVLVRKNKFIKSLSL